MSKWRQGGYSFIIEMPKLHSRIVWMSSTYNVVEEEYLKMYILEHNETYLFRILTSILTNIFIQLPKTF